MKLHLGCGDLYLPDALNIDRYDLRIADVQADAVRLPVKAGACDAVVAYHLFEHLGYTAAVYALAESFRVLRPGGVLELETPDPETSFRAFLDRSEPLWRAGILAWIFGSEVSGMGHRGLFPKELLEKLVTEAGFCRLKFSDPKTHRHRWGQRLVAERGIDPAAQLLSRLRPSLASVVLKDTSPQEALEIELRIWAPLIRLFHGESPPENPENLFLDIAIIAPQVILLWSRMSQAGTDLPEPPGEIDLKGFGWLADTFIKIGLCHILRDAFSALCAQVNQVSDGYGHIFAGAKKAAKKWLSCPPQRPREELLKDLEDCGVKVCPDANLTYPGDPDAASGKSAVDGRRPSWPNHGLFTRQHLIERARWFRDLGIRCFSLGRLDDARRLFRLAINSKMEGLYSVWNMARLQAALGQKANSEIFYRAALGFPMPDELKELIVHELKHCTYENPASTRPVLVGEGQDRITDLLEKRIDERYTFSDSVRSDDQCSIPPPKTLLWELTLKCQCRCSHCAAAGGKPRPDELTSEEAIGVCDQIAGLGVSAVCLMGGEALLHPDWESISLRLREHGLTLGLATNGIALDTQTWIKLERMGFSQVVISLDGASVEIHDRRRQRKGALAAAQKAIKEMTLRPLKERTVVTSVDSTNIGELEAIRDWLLENAPGITWMINMANPTPGGRLKQDKAIEEEGFLTLVRFIHENRAKYKDDLTITGTHNIGYFSKQYKELHNFTWSGCQAGITTLGLRSDGNVTGCLIMSDAFIEGNVRKRSLADIWKDPDSFSYSRKFSIDQLKGKCRSCRWGGICRGGCRETAFSFTGSPFESPFCLFHLESHRETA